MIIEEYLLLEPNRNTDIKMFFEWMTKIQLSINGFEKRTSIKMLPLRSIEFKITGMTAAELNLIKRVLYKNIHKVFGVPIWQDATALSFQAVLGQNILLVEETDYKIFDVGSPCIIYIDKDTYEIGTIASKISTQIILQDDLIYTWPKGALVICLFQGRITSGQKITLSTPKTGVLNFKIEEAFDPDIIFDLGDINSFPVYNGKPYFNIKPNWVAIKNDVYKAFEVLSFYGKDFSESLSVESFFVLEFQYFEIEKENINLITTFFNDRRGRAKQFWISSWQNDVVITTPFLSTDTIITVQDIDWSSYWGSNVFSGIYLCFQFPDMTYLNCKVLSAPSSTTLQLDQAIGYTCLEENLSSVMGSFLYMVRFNQDKLDLKYLNDKIAKTSLWFKTLINAREIN